MPIPIYQVDAFAERPFGGNPAGVCLLETARNEVWMQAVAAEMNLSETAFAVKRSDGDFDLRWFTPAAEVDLCGHATLATAYILSEIGVLTSGARARFHTKSGLLTADRLDDGRIELDFPAIATVDVEAPGRLLEALGGTATYVGKTRFDYLVELPSETAVRGTSPDFPALKRLGVRGIIVTAKADATYDFVSRFFAPGVGIDEDPVTGSAHCALAPYWSTKLGKLEMTGFQASARGGTVYVRLAGDRIKLAGGAVTVIRGELSA
jgi:PhzF family phenazine biosynthesis protein